MDEEQVPALHAVTRPAGWRGLVALTAGGQHRIGAGSQRRPAA